MTRFLLVVLFYAQTSFGGDTLYTHPIYPPIVFEGDEYNFFKYNPRYIPQDLLQAFKILATFDSLILDRFAKRSQMEVIERGIFDRGYRMRKEFCLESYSRFTQSFHHQGIYSPFVMETFILLSFHQYLNQLEIAWKENKVWALEDHQADNKSWKVRARKLYRMYAKHRRQSNRKLEEIETTEEDFFYLFGDESWQNERPRKLKRKVPDR